MKTKITLRERVYEIRPITQSDLDAVLEVYRQCEDFLALGPVATASMQMVLKDLEISRDEHGIFCGIYGPGQKMNGVLDYVPGNYQGDPQAAYLSLLMLGAPYRNLGLGQAVVYSLENELRKDARITKILAGVQVNNPAALKFWQRLGFKIVGGPKLLPDTTTVSDLRKDLDVIADF